MNYKNILVICVFMQWVLTALATGIGFFEEKILEGVSAEVLIMLDSIELSLAQYIFLSMALVAILLLFASSVALCFVKPWARNIYTISYLVSRIS